MAAGNPGINMGTSGSLHETDRASDELRSRDEAHRREHRATRPSYEHYRPANRYGHPAARHHVGRERDDRRTTWSAGGTRRAASRGRGGTG